MDNIDTAIDKGTNPIHEGNTKKIFNSLLRGFLCLCLLGTMAFSKVSNTGKVLPETVALGSGADAWGCTYDSKTQLTWEIKTDDGGLRDKDWSYTWYNADSASNGGNSGIENGSNSNKCDKSSYCNTQDYAQRVNSQGMCGYKDWRLPTATELITLIYCSNGKYNALAGGSPGYICPENSTDQKPTIDSIFFPNTSMAAPHYAAFWTSTTNINASLNAWYVHFLNGRADSDGKGSSYTGGAIRLVRGEVYNGDATQNSVGYIEGNISSACTGKPLSKVDVQFSNGRIQQTDRDGHYGIELTNGHYVLGVQTLTGYQGQQRELDIAANEIRNGDLSLNPSLGCNQNKPIAYKAIIVAGTGRQLPEGQGVNHIWASTQALADRAYAALLSQNFKRETIRYLSAEPTSTLAYPIDGIANLANLEQTLTGWAKGVDQVIIYLVGHGGKNTFQLNSSELLKPSQLSPWLDSLQANLVPGSNGQAAKINLVMDACKSGSFIAPLAKPERNIITSTAADLDAIISNVDGSNSFSYHFWGQIGFKDGQLSTAYKQARQSMSSESVAEPGIKQKAQLDTDGSGQSTEEDYALLSGYCFGECKTHASITPVIQSLGPLQDLKGQLTANLTVTASKPIAKAWATIQRPDYHFPTSGTAQASFLQVDLTCPIDSQRCEEIYNNFNVNDNYVVTFYVLDADNNLAIPRSIELHQTGITRSGDKKIANATFEDSTGVLTLKDISVAGQHYYVELINQGRYQFAIQRLQPLTEAASDTSAVFDGAKVSVPSVFAFGSYYSVALSPVGELFAVSNAVPK